MVEDTWDKPDKFVVNNLLALGLLSLDFHRECPNTAPAWDLSFYTSSAPVLYPHQGEPVLARSLSPVYRVSLSGGLQGVVSLGSVIVVSSISRPLSLGVSHSLHVWGLSLYILSHIYTIFFLPVSVSVSLS